METKADIAAKRHKNHKNQISGFVNSICYNKQKSKFRLFTKPSKAKLGAKAIGRRELENNEGYELKEPQSPYNRVFDPEKCSLRLKNDHIW